MSLTLDGVLGGLRRQAAGYLTLQQTRPGRFDTGAVIRAEWGLDEPGGTAGLVALSLWTFLLSERYPGLVRDTAPDAATLAERSLLALNYLERVQRPSGLTDLRDCNYDSSPDAGFILQNILPPLLLSRSAMVTGSWREIIDRLTGFARRMTVGACTGGIHTPNHRWVLVGALHLARQLFPEIPEISPTIAAYLAEGMDADEEGFWIERSAGVYDAICARSLLLFAGETDNEEILQAVARNLEADRYLLNADGTIETGLSHRQDAGIVPPFAANLAVPYLLGHFCCRGNEAFAGIADWLWETTPPERRDYYGMSQVLLAYGEPSVSEPPPSSCTRYFPKNGLLRVRRGPLSASLFRGRPRLLNLRYGSAFLASMSIHHSYFGVGQFLGEEMTVEMEGKVSARLHTDGRRHHYRPGYDLPLGREVSPEHWAEARAEREIRRVPPMASELTVDLVEAGLALRYRNTDGLDRVTTQIAFDFPVGGVWETDDCSLEPQAGQTIFLKRGYGVMRFPGTGEAIRIGPGADAHRMVRMRDASPPAAPGLVRVLMTFVTPMDHAFTVFGGVWPDI